MGYSHFECKKSLSDATHRETPDDPRRLAAIAGLSTRAIATLTGTSQGTVAKVRAVTGTPGKRREASGKQARGPRPLMRDHADRLPDGSGTLYRCYTKRNELLFIGTSFDFILQLATLSRAPWHRQIDHTSLTHYATMDEALAAATAAIRREQPRHNTAPSRRHDVTVVRHAPGSGSGAKRQPAPVIPPPAPGVTRIKRPTGRVPV
jgi:hypothetical protein